MAWQIHPERLTVDESDDGPFADEPTALAALVEQLHAMRNRHIETARSVETNHGKRAARHHAARLERRLGNVRQRQRVLGGGLTG